MIFFKTSVLQHQNNFLITVLLHYIYLINQELVIYTLAMNYEM